MTLAQQFLNSEAGGTVEYRDKQGRFIVLYVVPKGYIAVGQGKYKNHISAGYFDKLDDAIEHAELELEEFESKAEEDSEEMSMAASVVDDDDDCDDDDSDDDDDDSDDDDDDSDDDDADSFEEQFRSMIDQTTRASAFLADESLGSMKAIPKNLMRPFKTFSGQLKKQFGQNSPIIPTPIINGSQVSKELDKPHVAGIYITIQGMPLFTVARAEGIFGSASSKWTADVVHSSTLTQVMSVSLSEEIGELLGMLWTREAAKSKIAKVMARLIKIAKKNNLKISGVIIGVDQVRLQKQAQRRKLRDGLEPLPGHSGYDAFLRNARKSLEDRLIKFKADKAQDIEDPDELQNLFDITKYRDPIKVMGKAYNYYNDKLDIRTLIGDGYWGDDEGWVEYRLDIDNFWNKVGKVEADLEGLEESLAAGEISKSEYKELRKKALTDVVPSRIRIYLNFEKNVLVPTRVSLSHLDWGFRTRRALEEVLGKKDDF